MYRIAISVLIAVMGSLVSAQTPYTKPDIKELAQKSRLVVVGRVEGGAWVIRPEKRVTKSRQLPNGNEIVEIQNPSEYVVGHLVRLRVTEVLKKRGRVEADNTITVFMPGRFGAHDVAALIEKQTYVLFLSPFEAYTDDFNGTKVYQPGSASGGETSFDPGSSYILFNDRNSALRVEPSNRKIINEVRVAVRNPRK